MTQLENVLAQATPGIQVSPDPANARLLIVGDAQQQQIVQDTLTKLDALEQVDAGDSVAVYDVAADLAPQIAELLQPPDSSG